jgi:hypothetical protein
MLTNPAIVKFEEDRTTSKAYSISQIISDSFVLMHLSIFFLPCPILYSKKYTTGHEQI